MMRDHWCSDCGHHDTAHYDYGRGACGYRIPRESSFDHDYEWRCPCPAFTSMRSLGVLVGVRVLVILMCCAVLGSLPAVVDLVTGTPR